MFIFSYSLHYCILVDVHCWYCFPGEFVAQFKFTVLLMSEGTRKITGLPFEADHYKSEHSIEDEEVKVCLKMILILLKSHVCLVQ